METALAIVAIIIAVFYFSYRFFWGGKTLISWIKGDENGAEHARKKSVGWPIFVVFLAGLLIIFLYIILIGDNFLFS